MGRNLVTLCALLHLSAFDTTESLFNGFFDRGPNQGIQSINKQSKDAEIQLLTILENAEIVGGRGAKLSGDALGIIENNINLLENGKSIANPTSSPVLDGCWKLLYTSSPGTNSPIQRTFTSFDGVSVYQIVNTVNTKNSFLPDSLPDVSNTVCFGESTRLRVTALASTLSKPQISPRQGDGKIFGFNIFGISSSRAPRDPSERIDFAFQEARFEFKGSSFSIPYPVPFKLLGDEAKGWLDITYLSEELRIARGNKGTIFVLKKVDASVDTTAAFASQIDLSTAAAPTTAKGALSAPPVKIKPTGKAEPTSTAAQLKLKSARRSPLAVIVFPAQLGTEEDYEELSSDVAEAAGLKMYTAPLSRLDWPIGLLPSLVTKEYITGNLIPSKTLGFYLKKVDEAVDRALEENPDAELVLLAHSIGGWIARVWLSEWTTPERRARVRKVVTLGSPHNPPPSGSAMAKIDQTRGLLRYITENFPGAYEADVKYVSVIGTGVTGSLTGGQDSDSDSDSKRGEENGLIHRLESLVAYSSYSVLSGEGEGSLGDGIIPLACAELSGAEVVRLEDTKHSNFLPFPGKSIRLPLLWYGSRGVLDKWINYLL